MHNVKYCFLPGIEMSSQSWIFGTISTVVPRNDSQVIYKLQTNELEYKFNKHFEHK